MERLGDDRDRSTAPQSPYGWREVRLGLSILFMGLVVAFGMPFVAF